MQICMLTTVGKKRPWICNTARRVYGKVWREERKGEWGGK